MKQSISPHTKLMALIGNPVEHSLSPAIQNKLINVLGEDAVYLAFCIQPDHIEHAVQAMRTLPICGMNVTAPYKQAVIPFLDAVDSASEKYHAVNVIQNHAGRLIGYNTDIAGLFMYLKQMQVSLKGKSVLLIGAGGLATSLMTGIWDESPSEVTIINRTPQKAKALADWAYRTWGHRADTTLKGSPYDVIINASTAGMHPHEGTCALDSIEGIIDEHSFVFDSIYNPAKTLLLTKAEQAGASILNGYGMLVCQALLSYEIFTGQTLPTDIYQKFIHQEF